MIYNINDELRDFTYITSVYKCISAYNLKGHQIGRKIGDMLEILTMGGIYNCPELLARLNREGELEGFTTAGHKVEFGFYDDARNKRGLFGAVECKCVGVEETNAGKGQAYIREVQDNGSFTIGFKGQWMTSKIVQTVTVISHLGNSAVIRLSNNITPSTTDITISVGENIKIVVDENENLLHTTPHGNMFEEIPGIIRLCKKIKLDAIHEETSRFLLYDCLAGPQTIEKAKQASLVAMDLRKKIDGHWGKEEVPDDKKKMNFITVICEFSHWEEKSRNVITTCIDDNLIVPDAVLIKAFEVFEETFGIQNMLDMIRKNSYAENDDVRKAIGQVFEHFENHVFYDIAKNSYVRFAYQEGKLVVKSLQ